MRGARFEEARGALVVFPRVRALDSAAAPGLRTVVGERARGRALVVLSLASVHHVDCSGLAALVAILKRMAPGGELRLAGANRQVRTLLSATHLDELFPAFDDVLAALPPAGDAVAAPSP